MNFRFHNERIFSERFSYPEAKCDDCRDLYHEFRDELEEFVKENVKFEFDMDDMHSYGLDPDMEDYATIKKDFGPMHAFLCALSLRPKITHQLLFAFEGHALKQGIKMAEAENLDEKSSYYEGYKDGYHEGIMNALKTIGKTNQA